MASVLSVMSIASCVFNQYSFTKDNIDNNIKIYTTLKYEVDNHNSNLKYIPKYEIKKVPAPASEHTHYMDKTITQNEKQIASTENTDTDIDSDKEMYTPPDMNIEITHDNVVKQNIISNTIIKFDDIANYYVPKPEDSLLWCAYIMLNGIEMFEMIDNYYTEGNKFKFQLVGDIRSKKTLLKPHKLTLSKVEDCLVNKHFLQLDTFYAIALCYNLSVCVINGRKLFEIGRNNDDAKTFVIEKRKGKFGIFMFSSGVGSGSGSGSGVSCIAQKKNALDYIRDNYWSMENINSPIRPLSAYKLPDLVDICTRLNIPTHNQKSGEFGSIGTEKRKTKGELYEAICQHI